MKLRGGHIITLHLLPLLIPFAAFLLTGITVTVLQSLNLGFPFSNTATVQTLSARAADTQAVSPEAGGTVPGLFSAYREILQSPFFYESVRHSLFIALVSAAASVAAGTALALLIWRTRRAVKKYTVIYKLPLILPHITVAFIVLILFSQSGILSSLAYKLGLIGELREFPNIFYNKTGTGIILSYIWKESPFAALMILSLLQSLDIRYLQTGSMLGGSYFRNFRFLILPHISPALHTSFIILFLYSFGAFDIPFLVGESSPRMLSITVYNLYFREQLSSRPQAMAVLTLMFLFSLIFISLYTRSVSSLNPKARKV